MAQDPEDAYSIAEKQFFAADYGAAIRTALEGLQQEPARSSEESAVELCSILGASYSRLGAFDKAAGYFFRCYEFDRKEGNSEGMSSTLINLASMYVYAGKPELAEEYVLKAVDTEKPLRRPAKLAMAYGKACDVYHALKQEETALEYANLSVATAKETEDPGAVATRRSQRAYPLLALGRYREAAEDLFYAEKVFQDNGNRQSLSIVWFQLAGLHEKTGRNTLATEYYRKAQALSEELPDIPLDQKICHDYAEHLKKSNPVEAYEMLSRSASLAQQIAENESSRALELFNIEYETAKKEDQIAAQKRRLSLMLIVLAVLLAAACITAIAAVRLRVSRRKLQQSNAQKDFLFKAISHDILSPAIAMLRGIQMLRGHSSVSSDPLAGEAIVQLERQAESEVELIDNVLRWARNKEESSREEKVRFNLIPMVHEAMEQYKGNALQKGIDLEVEAPGEMVVVCSNRNHLLLSLRNLLSNAIKFSNHGGRVTVRVQHSGDGIDLSVKDCGIGIPADKLETICKREASFRRQGTDGEPSHGLGLAVCRDLVEDIDGTLSVHSSEGKGSIFTIHIPGRGTND